MNHRTKVSISLLNSAGDVTPVEKLLSLVINFPKTIVIKGKLISLAIEAKQGTALRILSRRSEKEKILCEIYQSSSFAA